MKVHDRTIFWGGDIDSEMAEDFIYNLKKMDKTRSPIEVICTGSSGGDYDEAAAGMMDAILSAENVVTTVCYGLAASSAALIFLCGDKRLLYPRSLLMFHKGSITLEEDLGELKKLTSIVEKQMEQDIQLLVERSNKPPTYWKEKFNKGDVYLWPQEALELDLATDIYE